LGYNKNQAYLTEVIQEFQRNGIRTSIFVDPIFEMIEGAKATGTDRMGLLHGRIRTSIWFRESSM
jgi:pyridoxine 5'-phosphate synthase PdxJ